MREAIRALSLQPLPFLLVVLATRALIHWNWGFLAPFMVLGYLLGVLEASLRERSLGSTSSLTGVPRQGCLGAIVICVGYVLSVVVAIFPVAIWETTFRTPTPPALVGPICIWATQSFLLAVLLASREEHRLPSLLWLQLRSLPLNLRGLQMLLVGLACYHSASLVLCSNALLMAVPLFLATLYCHLLGQHGRAALPRS